MGAEFLEKDYVHDIGGATPHSNDGKCMTLTKSRCSAHCGYYSSKRERPLTISDFLRLNVVPASRFAGWHQVISRSRMGSMCGNSETLNVLTPIIANALFAIGVPVKVVDFINMDLR